MVDSSCKFVAFHSSGEKAYSDYLPPTDSVDKREIRRVALELVTWILARISFINQRTVLMMYTFTCLYLYRLFISKVT